MAQETKVIAVHDGPFQADEVFAVAFLLMYHPLLADKEVEIIRTRNKESIDEADIVCDVGGVYNPLTERFDHHQFKKPKGQDYVIPNGLYGTWHVHESKNTGDLPIYLANRFFKRLVLGIDAIDNGMQQVEEGVKLRYRPCNISNLIASYNVDDCFEEKDEQLKQFHKAVDLALQYLKYINDGYWRDEFNFETIKTQVKDQTGDTLYLSKFYPGWLSMLNRAKALHKYKRIIWPTKDGEGNQEYRVAVPPVDLGQNKFICKYPGLDGSKVNPEHPEGHKEGDLVFVHEGKHIGATRSMQAALKL